jgi:signal transduction histidine kinase
MFSRWNMNLSSGARLISIAAVAVLFPVIVMSVVQYRSLMDLQRKTKSAAQDNLRQCLQSIARGVRDDFQVLAKQSFTQFEPKDLSPDNLDQIEARLAVTNQSHPEIDFLFVVSHCSCRGKRFALFYGQEVVRRIDDSQFITSPEVTQIVEEYDRASAARLPSESKQASFFGQSACSIFPDRRPGQLPLYVFYPLFSGAEEEAPYGFAGLALDQRFIQDSFLPKTIPEFLSGPASSAPDSELALAVFDGTNRRIYWNRPAANDYEVKAPFAPVFPKWQLAAGYKSTTIEALARDNFRKSLVLTLSVLLLLIFGITLILLATAREMKLAQAKTHFVSNVSHELKTPLALIRLFAETLELGRVNSHKKAEEYYAIINSESRRLTKLIDNILDFAKIESGRKEYRLAKCSVAEVVEDVLKTYDYQLSSAGFELKAEISPDLPVASIDRDAMSQALLNLLDNATKYSTAVKKIVVSVEERGPHIAIEVADSGIGIPLSEQPRIFEKFYRVSAGVVRTTKGSGLGLAVVKHIVEAHSGKVLVESRPGRGSRFTVLIPAISVETNVRRPSAKAKGYGVAERPNS